MSGVPLFRVNRIQPRLVQPLPDDADQTRHALPAHAQLCQLLGNGKYLIQ